MIHEVPVGIDMVDGQADIFIKVKRAAGGEIEFLLTVHLDQPGIDGFHRVAGRQPHDQTRIAPQLAGNDPRHQVGGGIGVRSNHNFHKNIN